MADVLRSGIVWLAQQLTANVSQTVTYARTGTGSISLAATIGRTAFRVEDQQTRVRLEWADEDFLIDVSLLKIGGNAIEPLPGDQVVWAGKTYEVQPFNGEPAGRYSDQYQLKWRIHTKRVA